MGNEKKTSHTHQQSNINTVMTEKSKDGAFNCRFNKKLYSRWKYNSKIHFKETDLRCFCTKLYFNNKYQSQKIVVLLKNLLLRWFLLEKFIMSS